MSEVKRYDEYECGVREVPEFGEYVKASDFDTQRLRADTAEANFNRCNGLYYECQKDRDTLRSDLAAAEQRIAELWTLLREGLEEQIDGDDWIDRVVAALNPNPEAESHEKH